MFLQSFDLQLWTRIGTMSLRPRASVLDCASPLALFDPSCLLKQKRQGTGAVQNLAALRRFMERNRDRSMVFPGASPKIIANAFIVSPVSPRHRA